MPYEPTPYFIEWLNKHSMHNVARKVFCILQDLQALDELLADGSEFGVDLCGYPIDWTKVKEAYETNELKL
jgi:hypothetical protein